MKVYTRRGDAGTTGLFYGGRVEKDTPLIEALGAIDEAQAALGVVRADTTPGSELDALLIRLERELYVLMAEVATAPAERDRLSAGKTLVTAQMVTDLEGVIDALSERFPAVSDFVIPGHDRLSAGLDVARTAVRRAERRSVGVTAEESSVLPYLNRLSDLLWTMARWQEHGDSLLSREAGGPAGGDPGAGGAGSPGATSERSRSS